MPAGPAQAIVTPATPQKVALRTKTAAAATATDTRERTSVWPQWLNRPKPIEAPVASPPQDAPSRTVTGWGRPQPPSALIDSAVTLVNSAFAETGARLVPAHAAMRREPVGPHSRALSIDVAGTSVGLMLIEPVSGRIDIAVGVADMANFDAARRRSHELAGLTVHPLAETIATCAWPAIAAAKGGA